MSNLQVNLQPPNAGWLPIKITGAEGSIEILASYTPRDSFRELVEAVYSLYQFGRPVELIFNEEPNLRKRFIKGVLPA